MLLLLVSICLSSLVSTLDVLDSKNSGKDLDNPFLPLAKSSPSSNSLSPSEIINAFKVSANTIIRTKESRSMGGKYLNESTVKSREECLSWCWRTKSRDSTCNLAVFEESGHKSCYLFDCGSNILDFKCKFTSHDSYSSSFINRASDDLSDWSQQSDHENQLMNLKNDLSKTTPIPRETKKNCQHFQFACKNSTECIAIYNVCDGIPQCSDGSDEAAELHCNFQTVSPSIPSSGSSKSSSREEFDLEDISGKVNSRRQQEESMPPSMVSTPSSLVRTHQFLESPPSSYHYPKVGSSILPSVSASSAPQSFSHHRYSNFIPASQQQSSSSLNQASSSLQSLDSIPQGSQQQESMTGVKYSSQPSPYFSSSLANMQDYFRDPANSDVKSPNSLISNSPDRLRQQSYYDSDNYQRGISSQDSSPLLWSVIANNLDGQADGQQQVSENARGDTGQRILANGIFDGNSLLLPKGFSSLYPVNDADIQQPVYNRMSFGTSLKDSKGSEIMLDRNAINSIYQRFNDPVFIPSDSSSSIRKQPHQSHHQGKAILPNSSPVVQQGNHKVQSKALKDQEPPRSPSLLSLSRNEVPVLAVSHLRDSDPSGRDTNSAVIALTLGLSITAMLIALVGCRMKSIKKRIARRGGRSLAHDADYLVNGMYL